jgi:hypothetical protein
MTLPVSGLRNISIEQYGHGSAQAKACDYGERRARRSPPVTIDLPSRCASLAS